MAKPISDNTGMIFGSLFAGIGGGDLGLENAGMTVKWQIEWDRFCNQLLENKWPGVHRQNDITNLDYDKIQQVDLVIGGDPCQCRSKMPILHESKHPDLSGYFLAVAARLRPRWVVRENVCSPDVRNFAAGLGLQGYGVVISSWIPDILRLKAGRGSSLSAVLDIQLPDSEKRFVTDRRIAGVLKRYARAGTKNQLRFVLIHSPAGFTRPIIRFTKMGRDFEFSVLQSERPCTDSQLAGLRDFLLHAVSTCSATP